MADSVRHKPCSQNQPLRIFRRRVVQRTRRNFGNQASSHTGIGDTFLSSNHVFISHMLLLNRHVSGTPAKRIIKTRSDKTTDQPKKIINFFVVSSKRGSGGDARAAAG
jgi:hypothetical protein